MDESQCAPCPYCGDAPVLVTGASLYHGHVPMCDEAWFWQCPRCRAHVGCHAGTQRPLGRVANERTRKARRRAHLAFDPLWKDRLWPRSAAYKWLAARLGIATAVCHISMMDETQCDKVVELMDELSVKLGRKVGA